MTGGLSVSASSPREAGRSAIGEQNPVDRPTLGRPVAPFESVRGREGSVLDDRYQSWDQPGRISLPHASLMIVRADAYQAAIAVRMPI